MDYEKNKVFSSQNEEIELLKEEIRSLKEKIQNETLLSIRLNRLLESVNIIPWEANPKTGQFTYVGAQAENILGYPVRSWLTKDFWVNHIHHEDRERAVALCFKESTTREKYTFDYRMIAADGRIVWIYDIVTVISENGKAKLLIGYMLDITDRKKFEQMQEERLLEQQHAREIAEQTMRMQDDFLSIAAHELRTPLTPISMQLQLLEKILIKNADSDFSISMKRNLLKLTQNSKREINRLSSLIEELLDVSRISAGRLVLNLKEVNLSTIVQSQIKRYQTTALKVGSLLHGRIEPGVVGIWDPTKLESLVENLLTNAIKFSDGNPIEVRVGIQKKSAILVVKDHGIGISKEDQQKIFKRFERAVSVKNYSGLGLGLFIASEIVKAHGGSIKLESEIHRGSTFVVELPLRQLANGLS